MTLTTATKKVCTVLGIRPDFIRMSHVLRKLDASERIDHVMIHTGQHYDEALSGVFFSQLGLRPPDFILEMGKQSTNHAEQLAYLSTHLFPLFRRLRPDLIVFLGDSNTVAVSIVLKKEGYRICHIEAGMRSGDKRMLEEINRIVCDHCSDLLFVYHPDYRDNLLRENISSSSIHVVGNTIIEPLQDFLPDLVSVPKSRNFILMDIHRPENFRYPNRLRHILDFGNICAQRYCVPVYLLDFPSLRAPLASQDLGTISVVPLMSFKEYLTRVYHARFLISDSGTGQEEPAFLGTKVVVPRDFTERPQSYAAGCSFPLRMTPRRDDEVFTFLESNEMDVSWLGKGDTSDRIVRHMNEFLFLDLFLATRMEKNRGCVEMSPFPHLVVDNFLPLQIAQKMQEDILECDPDMFDRYDNPFERKNTFRDKHGFPDSCRDVFDALQSPVFLTALNTLFGDRRIILDEHKHYWGIHTYKTNDYLDIHVDADVHPLQKIKKYLTLGIYLSPDWKDDDHGHLELWEGTPSSLPQPRISACAKTISPVFNRMVIFQCTDDSWHGNPTPVRRNGRIFCTLSYLTDEITPLSHRERALFIALPTEIENEEKNRLRQIRADASSYMSVYDTSASFSKKELLK